MKMNFLPTNYAVRVVVVVTFMPKVVVFYSTMLNVGLDLCSGIEA